MKRRALAVATLAGASSAIAGTAFAAHGSRDDGAPVRAVLRDAAPVPVCASAAGSAARAGTIGFVRGAVGRGYLHLMNSDGSRKCRAHGRGTAEAFPYWSPDGRLIAFPGGHGRLWIANADGSGRRALSPPERYSCVWLDWSPDGQKIAYTRNAGCDGPPQIHVVNRDGTGRRRITPGGDIASVDAAWSPDGHRLLFTRRDPGKEAQLYVMRADGRAMRPIRGALVLETGFGGTMRPRAAWSADGKSIVFISDQSSLNAINLDGTRRRILAPSLTDVRRFVLSPDGRRIAVAAAARSRRHIYVMNVDGSGLRSLTEGRGIVNDDPQWSPDGRRLTFERTERDGYSGIFLINADGTGERQIDSAGRAVAWAPRGRY